MVPCGIWTQPRGRYISRTYDRSTDRLRALISWPKPEGMEPKRSGEIESRTRTSNEVEAVRHHCFLDGHGIMRLNRRLEHTAMDFEAKYPIVAKDHRFVCGDSTTITMRRR